MTGYVHYIPTEDFDADGDGYSPYLIGGGLNGKVGRVAYNSAAPMLLFTLPARAVILAWQVNISTAFNDTVSNLLDIGTLADADAYANNLDVSAIGQIPNGFIPGALNTLLTTDTDVYATFTGGNSDAAAGAAQVTVFYLVGAGV